MKRQREGTEALVYVYGCGAPISGWQHAEAEAERIGILWDRLVGIERAHEAEIATHARADDPEIDRLLDLIDDIKARINGDRETRTKLIQEIRGARRDIRPLIWRWQRDHKDEMLELEHDRWHAVRGAQHASDAYWCNYEHVVERYETARRETARRGRRLRLRDVARDDGCLTVRIPRTRTGLGAAPDEIQNGAVSAVAIGVVPTAAHDPHTHRGDRRRACQTVIEMRVDRDGNVIRLPLWYHRPLPPHARVKRVQLTWSRVGDRLRYQLCLTVSQQSVARTPGGTGVVVVTVDPEMVDQRLRVATIDGQDGQRESIALDPHWLAMMDRVDLLPAIIGDDALPDQLRIRARLERPGLWGRLLRRRREQYRLAARALAMRYSVIRIETPALCEAAWQQRGTQENTLRHRACAHALIAEIEHQAHQHGCVIELAVQEASAPVPQRVRRRRNKDLRALPDGGSAALANDTVSA